MKYFIRSVKYFFRFCILLALIIFVLVSLDMVGGSIDEIFENGYDAIWQIAILFAAVAAVYPKIGFISRPLVLQASWDELEAKAVAYFEDRGFKLESKTADSLSFRRRGLMQRILKMGEDRIILSHTGDAYVLDGLRKDVILLSSGLEHSFAE